jgi:hypothetical protein
MGCFDTEECSYVLPCSVCKKGHHNFSIDSEDLVTEEKTIGIWLYSSKIPEAMVDELQNVLLKWSKKYDVKFQIYKSKNEFVTNG